MSNGGATVTPAQTSNNAQQSPVAYNNSLEANGGSPCQGSSLANELAKCQLRKVNLSRSDSDKESECNNNSIGNPKTTRAASLAYDPRDTLMSDLKKKLASQREKSEPKGPDASNNTSSTTNGTGNISEKLQETLIAEMRKEMSKMKAEILEAVRTEFKRGCTCQR